MIALLQQFSWLDLLDIAIVSVVIYRLLLVIRGTRAANILLGLMVLLLASVVSHYLQLHTVDWLLKSFLVYIVIAMIVIFQPEIRRALAKVGQAPYLQAFTSAEELKSLEQIVRAAVSLSERRIGALIVIERETRLEDFVELGTSLDARVSRDLLLSIFHTASPIHDGAIVINGNRIVAAGCFLPMAPSSLVLKRLGTRHRAALGLAEETDAVVIVVSEETGNITMAINGELEHNLEMTSLRDRLSELFTGKQA